MADANPGQPARPPHEALLATPASGVPTVEPIDRLNETRHLFWQNVVREMLLTFPLVAQHHPDATDGRIGVLTRSGERIPLASAEPLFPCSIADPSGQALCIAVQATVFNLRTPAGEVFTLPVSEVRGMHTMTDEALRAMEEEARRAATPQAEGAEPFGFAAFTSLHRARRDPLNQPAI